MKICSRCGNNLTWNRSFCPLCGGFLVERPDDPSVVSPNKGDFGETLPEPTVQSRVEAPTATNLPVEDAPKLERETSQAPELSASSIDFVPPSAGAPAPSFEAALSDAPAGEGLPPLPVMPSFDSQQIPAPGAPARDVPPPLPGVSLIGAKQDSSQDTPPAGEGLPPLPVMPSFDSQQIPAPGAPARDVPPPLPKMELPSEDIQKGSGPARTPLSPAPPTPAAWTLLDQNDTVPLSPPQADDPPISAVPPKSLDTPVAAMPDEPPIRQNPKDVPDLSAPKLPPSQPRTPSEAFMGITKGSGGRIELTQQQPPREEGGAESKPMVDALGVNPSGQMPPRPPQKIPTPPRVVDFSGGSSSQGIVDSERHIAPEPQGPTNFTPPAPGPTPQRPAGFTVPAPETTPQEPINFTPPAFGPTPRQLTDFTVPESDPAQDGLEGIMPPSLGQAPGRPAEFTILEQAPPMSGGITSPTQGVAPEEPMGFTAPEGLPKGSDGLVPPALGQASGRPAGFTIPEPEPQRKESTIPTTTTMPTIPGPGQTPLGPRRLIPPTSGVAPERPVGLTTPQRPQGLTGLIPPIPGAVPQRPAGFTIPAPQRQESIMPTTLETPGQAPQEPTGLIPPASGLASEEPAAFTPPPQELTGLIPPILGAVPQRPAGFTILEPEPQKQESTMPTMLATPDPQQTPQELAGLIPQTPGMTPLQPGSATPEPTPQGAPGFITRAPTPQQPPQPTRLTMPPPAVGITLPVTPPTADTLPQTPQQVSPTEPWQDQQSPVSMPPPPELPQAQPRVQVAQLTPHPPGLPNPKVSQSLTSPEVQQKEMTTEGEEDLPTLPTGEFLKMFPDARPE
ncbi:MAG: hypothetical protein LBT08_03585 [Synergistaceae bacterium]|nr:hypothetical protein [Synergistaceae bacterium]